MTIIAKLIRRAAIALVSTGLLPLAAIGADDAAKVRAIVDSAILPLMAEHDVPGMAVAVTIDGKPYFLNYGLASKEAKTPVTEATLFELGSISKVFTGTLASYAQVTGKLELSDHPAKYMPRLKGRPIDKASLLNLGTYTDGGTTLQFPEEVTSRGMPDFFEQWKPDAAPGVQRRYSNVSLGLFGHLTAYALKQDFSEAMETLVFPQLGLKHSYMRIPKEAMIDYAWGYDRANKPVRMNPGVLAAESYGVRSSSADMLVFLQANLDPSRLAAPMRRAVTGTHVGYFKVGDMVQGLGWEQYPFPITLERLLAGNSSTMIMQPNPAQRLTPPQAPHARTLFNKTGSTGGFGSYAAFVPEKKIGIVMLANKNYPIPARITAAHAILEQLAQH